MNQTELTPKDRRDIRTLGSVALWATLIATGIVTGFSLMPSRDGVDPATTPKVLADIDACVAAKPEIVAAARGERIAVDWSNVLERRLEAVNAHDPSQCGAMLARIREHRERLQNIAIMAAAAS